jgi:hypothetical protein
MEERQDKIMAQFTLTIELGNAAMQTSDDIAEALRETADNVAIDAHGTIRDTNGNKVGLWSCDEFKSDSDDEEEEDDEDEDDYGCVECGASDNECLDCGGRGFHAPTCEATKTFTCPHCDQDYTDCSHFNLTGHCTPACKAFYATATHH